MYIYVCIYIYIYICIYIYIYICIYIWGIYAYRVYMHIYIGAPSAKALNLRRHSSMNYWFTTYVLPNLLLRRVGVAERGRARDVRTADLLLMYYLIYHWGEWGLQSADGRVTSAPRAGAEFEAAFVDELTRMLESEGCTGCTSNASKLSTRMRVLLC